MYQNIYGEDLTLSISKHGSLAEEYVIEKPSFKIDKWFYYTVVFSFLFLYAGLHNQHTSLLGSLCIVLMLIALSKMHLKVKKGISNLSRRHPKFKFLHINSVAQSLCSLSRGWECKLQPYLLLEENQQSLLPGKEFKEQ